jgi:YKOF-related Family.
MNIQAEVSFYPLAQPDVNDCINKFCSVISNKGLSIVTNAISSVVSGDTANVMHTLSEAIDAVGQDSKFVLVCKISNACPVEHKENNQKL